MILDMIVIIPLQLHNHYFNAMRYRLNIQESISKHQYVSSLSVEVLSTHALWNL